MGLTPEQGLLLLCCSRPSPEREARLQRQLAAAPDWEEVLRLAPSHRVLGWLAATLKAHAVPAAVRERLAGLWEDETAAALRLCAELQALLRRFEAAGLEVLALKGPALAFQVYGDLSRRSFADLDLLVHEADLDSAQRILEERGYRPEMRLERGAEKACRRAYTERMFYLPGAPLAVDLHWDLATPRLNSAPVLREVWARRAAVRVGPSEVRTLSLADHLHLVVLHAAKHGWLRLDWVCDLAQLAQTRAAYADDPVWAVGRRPGAGRLARWGWALARALLSAPIPDAVAGDIARDGAIPGLVQGALRMMFVPGFRERFWAPKRLYARALEDRRDRLRVWRHFFLTPKGDDFTAFAAPAAMPWLYGLLRPARLAVKYASRLFHPSHRARILP